MSGPQVLLCAVPLAHWPTQIETAAPGSPLGDRLRELRTIERRLGKAVNTDEERTRYAAACAEIEDLALAGAELCTGGRAFKQIVARGGLPATHVGPAYVELLDCLRRNGTRTGFQAPGRLGATIVGPAAVAEHLQWFRRWARQTGLGRDPAIRQRLAFLRKLVKRHGCGFIEVQDVLAPGAAETSASRPPIAVHAPWRQRLLAWMTGPRRPALAAAPSGDWLKYGQGGEDRGAFMRERLQSQIEQSLAGGGVVNMSGQQRHELATEVLNGYVRMGTFERAGQIRILYGDGSEARPFPLRCVRPGVRGWQPTRELHVALISMRHLLLDREIDLNWYRNVEVPATQTMAKADEYCFSTSLAQLDELHQLYRGDRLLLHLYHTGFEPAVIGFYRALLTRLASPPWWRRWFGRGADPGEWIKVVPKYVREGEGMFGEGQRWPG